jgi:hypothetical protein
MYLSSYSDNFRFDFHRWAPQGVTEVEQGIVFVDLAQGTCKNVRRRVRSRLFIP